MADSIKELEVAINLRFDKYEKDLKKVSDQTDKSAKKMASSFSSIKGALGAIGLTLGMQQVLGFLKESIQLAKEQLVAQNKVSQAIRNSGQAAGFTAKELFKMSEALEASTGIDTINILNDVTNILLTFNKIQGKVFSDAQKTVLDLSVAMGGDLRGSAIQLAKALQDPIKGINAMTRSGVSFTESEKEKITQLVKSGNLYEAQTLILKVVNAQVEGQAEAAYKAEGGLGTLNTTVGNLSKGIGLSLLPALNDLAGALNDVASDGDKANSIFQSIGTVAALIVLILKSSTSVVITLWTEIYNLGDALVKVVSGDFKGAINALGNVVDDAKNGASSYADSWVDAFSTIKQLWTDTSGVIEGQNLWNPITGQLINQKNKVNGNGNGDGDGDEDDKKLTYIQALLKQEEDLKTKIADVEKAMKDENITASQQIILYRELLKLKGELYGLVDATLPEIPIDDELEGEDTILPDVRVPASGAGKRDNYGPAKNDAEDVSNTLTEGFSDANNLASLLSNTLMIGAETAVGVLINGLQTASSLLNSIFGIISAITGGGGGLIASLFGHSGGTFMDGRKVPGLASGGTAYVPNGYLGDRFPVMVESGEKLQVTSRNGVAGEQKYLAEISGDIKNLRSDINVLSKEIKKSKSQPIHVDGKKITKEITSIQNKLKKTGLQLEGL